MKNIFLGTWQKQTSLTTLFMGYVWCFSFEYGYLGGIRSVDRRVRRYGARIVAGFGIFGLYHLSMPFAKSTAT